MRLDKLQVLKCPLTGSELEIDNAIEIKSGRLINGFLRNNIGNKFSVSQSCVDFMTPEQEIGNAGFARSYYSEIAKTYDENVSITFGLYNENELEIRNKMIDLLELKPDYKVLEIAAGTGKDSELIASRMNNDGELWLLDISPHMITFNIEKLRGVKVNTQHIVASACSLPFKDNYFDALYCFAGIGHFPDLPKGLKEMARVVRPGGKVVFCEKNVPYWLRQTEYGKICINNNPMFADPVPLEHIPVEARNVGVRWINGNVHYVFDYTVGEGEPKGNFDLELPGKRGGTFNTRYYGKLEGVTNETKKLALRAQEFTGKSMHKWLDEIIKREAEEILRRAGEKNEMD